LPFWRRAARAGDGTAPGDSCRFCGREQHLRRIGKQWAHQLAGYGRLRVHVSQDGPRRLNLGEIRCRATTVARDDWTEPGLSIELRSLILTPQEPVQEGKWVVARCGLHSLGRWYQRADRPEERMILAQLAAKIWSWRAIFGCFRTQTGISEAR